VTEPFAGSGVTTRAYEVVDAFTDTPLEGNPAAIFSDGRGLSAELMQRVARELNLSETVFVLPAQGEGDARVRIFTPAAELPFAGHPVLATAFVLGRGSGAAIIGLETGAGLVSIALQRTGDEVTFGEMEQPIPVRESFAHQAELLAALGVERSELPVEAYRNGPAHVYVALESEERVAALRPNVAALEDLGDQFGFSCFAGGGGNYKTRMFAPALGVREDPATGSAAGPLALHLARHGWIGYGDSILIRQGEEIHRPSLIRARVEGSDQAIERITVGGSAVIVARGEYRLE
jgi:trans-2,3-dihydro-3-hydroxyanthranilate isomerase